MVKKISILGCSGSIGTQALKTVDNLKNIEVTALSAYQNTDFLSQMARKYKVKMVAIGDQNLYNDLKIKLNDTNVKVMCGSEGIIECAVEESCEMVLNSVMGSAGMLPTIEAIKHKKTIALANKESLVVGGEIIMPLANEMGVDILPVDSEHSAIFQCLCAGNQREVKKLILTASGGPFFGYTKEQLKRVTKEQALKHPNWEMGAKITIDSATLMNKGLEFIEAMHLFNVSPDMIEVIVHRESIIHSMVEFVDSSVIAQLGSADMCHPIGYALTYPDRVSCGVEGLDFKKLAKLTFFEPDMQTFGCLSLAIESAKIGGTATAVLNGANEMAVELFLSGKIKFYQIENLVEKALTNHKLHIKPTIHDIIEADKWSREMVKSLV